MTDFLRDLKYASRHLLEPTVLTAVLVLTLGLAANSAIFSIVNSVLLQPFDYEEPERIVRLWERFWRESEERTFHFSEVELVDLRRLSDSFSDFGAYYVESKTLTREDDHPQQILTTRVTPGLFSVLGVEPTAGRVFLSEEEQPGREKVAILSQTSAENHFGRVDCVGETLRLDGESYEVVGVVGGGFQFPPRYESGGVVEVWIPEKIDLANLSDERSGAQGRYLSMLARLAPGVSVEKAQAEMDRLARQFQEQYPDAYRESKGFGIEVLTLLDAEVGKIRPGLWALFGTGILTLLITCFNVGVLLLTRTHRRQRELALRTALGAGRLRMVRQLLTESLLISIVSCGLALLLSFWLLQLVLAVTPPEIPRLDEVDLDFFVYGFTVLIALLSGVASGLAPLFLLSGNEPAEELKQGGTRLTRGSHLLRNALLTAELAVALVVLIGAGLLIKNFLALRSIDPGFLTEGRITLEVTMPLSKYNTEETIIPFQDEMLERIAALPGVERVGFSNHLPLDGDSSSWGISVEGFPLTPEEGLHQVDFRAVSPGYLKAMGTPLVEGSDFDQSLQNGPPWQVIVDERLARHYWPGESAVGKRIRRGREKHGRPWADVIGVARHVKHNGVDDDSERDQVYYPHRQLPYPYISLVVQSGLSDPLTLVSAIRKEIAEIDPDQPVGTVRRMEDWVADSLAKPRFSMLLLVFFAGIALVLVSGGTYGLFNAVTTERSRDIGIRIALGSSRAGVVGLVLRQSLLLALWGVGLGVATALVSTRLLATQLHGISTTDLPTFLGVPLLLITVVLLATFLPARRAASVDPVVVLRDE